MAQRDFLLRHIKKKNERFVLQAMLKEAGADSVWIDKVGNAIVLTQRQKTLTVVWVLMPISDTVSPIETDAIAKFKGDTLYAPGINYNTQRFGFYFLQIYEQWKPQKSKRKPMFYLSEQSAKKVWAICVA
ncbi:MAG: hypothetical protein U5M51_09740 [Emticicia sp.]|nr:hypothetical protein [Emticicia sp.]